MGEHEIAMRMLEHAGVDEASPPAERTGAFQGEGNPSKI
jgi:hypothetical protein